MPAGVLTGLPFAAETTVGYPAMSARVDYEGTGYRTFMAWVQTVRTVRTTTAGDDDRLEVDLAPVLDDVDSPFFVMGSNPSVVDVPAHNLNAAHRLVWTADTFLTTLPLRSRAEPIRRLSSFRWGYTETSTPGQRPVIQPLLATEPLAWSAVLPLLRTRFPRWTFT